MSDVYIVEACRSAIGKRGKGLAGLKPADLLGLVQKAALNRAKVAPENIDQVIGGCVSQVGEQTFNIARIAWLSQGLPLEVPSTTVDAQWDRVNRRPMAATMVARNRRCGDELWCRDDRVPLGSAMKMAAMARITKFYQPTSQFMGAAMIAGEYQITREDTDRFGLESQNKAIRLGKKRV